LGTGVIQPSITIDLVRSRQQWRDFHHVSYHVFAGDGNWVPPLLLERKLHFSAKHNPFFQHAEAEFWVAYRHGKPVGRITAQVDHLHIKRYGDGVGFFGFIEASDDQEVFDKLLTEAERWLLARGLKRARGPVSFSMWDQPGLLVEGFGRPPSVMMNYAQPYFADRIERASYRPVRDLLAYEYDGRLPFPELAARLVERGKYNRDIVIRPISKSRVDVERETNLLLDIINDAWSDNWGFVPMTEAEIKDLATVFRFLLRPGDVAIAEYKGRPVAFALIIPNLNEVIADLRGRLAPFGWIKLLWRLKVRSPYTARMPLMGVRRSLQSTPLGAALALLVIDSTRKFNIANGTPIGELSWILDKNERAQHIIDLVGAKPIKRYRIFEKELGQ
jgi:hypothetical protein